MPRRVLSYHGSVYAEGTRPKRIASRRKQACWEYARDSLGLIRPESDSVVIEIPKEQGNHT